MRSAGEEYVMSVLDNLTWRQLQDLGNKHGGEVEIKRFLSGELVLVEKERKVSVAGLANGGVTYTTGINEGLFKADWEKHLLEVYGITIDLAGVSMPQSRSGVRLGRCPATGATGTTDVRGPHAPL